MKKLFVLFAVAVSAMLFSGCGGCGATGGNSSDVTTNAPSDTSMRSGQSDAGILFIGRWKTNPGSINNGDPLDQFFRSIYVFRNDNTCMIRTLGTNMDNNFKWVVKSNENKITLNESTRYLTRVYTYSMPDQNTLLLIDSMNYTNHLTRIQKKYNQNDTANNNNKKAYIKIMKKKMEKWNVDLVELGNKTATFTGKSKEDFRKSMMTLSNMRDAIDNALHRINSSTDNSWEDIKDILDDSTVAMDRSIMNFKARFK